MLIFSNISMFNVLSYFFYAPNVYCCCCKTFNPVLKKLTQWTLLSDHSLPILSCQRKGCSTALRPLWKAVILSLPGWWHVDIGDLWLPQSRQLGNICVCAYARSLMDTARHWQRIKALILFFPVCTKFIEIMFKKQLELWIIPPTSFFYFLLEFGQLLNSMFIQSF